MNKRVHALLIWTVSIGFVPACLVHAAGPSLTIGSKAFTESVILGDMVAILAKNAGAEVRERRELGGTQVLWNALQRGEIDLYPEYTGTITQEILPQLSASGKNNEEAIRSALEERGVRMSRSLGFNDTYAIGMKEEVAMQLSIETISDLRRHPELNFGFSNEFMDRGDGWPGLRARYALPQRNARGMDHELAYRALESGAIHATDLYSTDAEIQYRKLRVLRDDLGYFPQYDAVLLYRDDASKRAPDAIRAILQLEGRISEQAMIEMNARAKLDKVPEERIASEFLAGSLGLHNDTRDASTVEMILQRTKEHLLLVAVSLTAAIVVSIPLGIFANKFRRAGQVILALTGVIQTIPSLALLVFMIPLLGIGGPPAIVALFLYSLLPIVRNTYTGLRDIAPSVRESAAALGLPEGPRLRLIELPIASRSILAGIKTSAVINVGTATLGALIGAGGYGQPILTGIRLDDTGLILQGAVPAAILALLVQGAFELAERSFTPRGLRLRPE
ncbi:MAG: ABC transporter permease subunit [Acidobacteria bacterium]|nr:ABC transporter permease subunit [Acidobacteriota bacterium]